MAWRPLRRGASIPSGQSHYTDDRSFQPASCKADIKLWRGVLLATVLVLRVLLLGGENTELV